MAKAITKAQLNSCLGRISDYFIQMNEDFSGATSSADGEKGMVPQPEAGDNSKFLRGDGTWADPVVSPSGTLFVVSSVQPSASVLWIKPSDNIQTVSGNSYIISDTIPVATDTMWIKPIE
jgi:hypothetical protein